MRKLRALLLRFGGLFNKSGKDRELDDEIESHLQLNIEDNLRLGMRPEEARRQALIKLGGIESTKEAYRDQRGLPMLETLWQDIRYGARMLRKNPAFTVVAVLTLALGIGANTAMFSIIEAVLFRPMPFAKPDQLIGVWQEYPKRGWTKESFSLANFVDLQKATDIFSGAGAYSLSAHTLTGVEQPEVLNSIRMTVSLLPTLGVSPVLGRNLREEEDRAEAGLVVLISDSLWRRRFHADPGVIGRSIGLNDTWAATIVGVLPANFRIGPENPDLCLPLRLDPTKVGRGHRGLQVIARLKPGVSRAQLKSKLDMIANQLRAADSWANGEIELSSIPLHKHLVDHLRASLLMLGSALGFVLLIACANIANLSLARTFARRQEIIIRAAIGAARGRIVRQLITESLVLSFTGGAAGFLLATWGISIARNSLTARLPEASGLSIDATVLVFSFLASILTGVFCGLFPALSASRVSLLEGLKEGTRSATTGMLHHRMRSALVVAEVSLAFVLLVGAGLLLKSLDRLLTVHPGFDPVNLLAVQTTLTGNRYNATGTPTDLFPTRRAAVNEMIAHLESLPGVRSVTFGTSMPLEDDMDASGAAIEGKTFAASNSPFVHLRGIRANYFQTLRATLLEGRHLTEADSEAAPKVALINRTLARQYWPGESAVGKRIRPDAFQSQDWLTVVGVLADMKNESLAKPSRPELYYPYAQFPTRGMCALLRTSVPPFALMESARREIWKVDGNLAIVRTQTMDQAIHHSASSAQLQSILLSASAGFALILAAVGIYSVLAYSASQRSKEIGIRIALGARTENVYALVLGSGLKPVLLGLGIGIVAALALARFLARLLFEVRTTDLATFSLAALILGLTGLIACLWPARRATKVDPMVALRYG